MSDCEIVVLTKKISASVDRVFSAWTIPETMRKWLAPGPCEVVEAKNDLRTGGSFRIVSEAAGQRHTISGRYLEIDRNRRLTMTWLYQGPLDFLDGVETRLELEFKKLGEQSTELTLRHRDIPTQRAHDAFEADWPSCFEKLDRELEREIH